MTSILPSSPLSISPTAARSRVGTSWIAASGRPASRRPCAERGDDGAARAQTVGAAAQDRGIAGFQAQRAGIGGHVRPAFIDDADDAERHPHALDVMPFGRVQDSVTAPTGSLSARTASMAAAIASTRAIVEHQPVEEGPGHAGARAPRRYPRHWRPECAAACARTAPAMSSKARSFWAVEASAKVRAAARAWRPISPKAAAISPVPSMLFSGALMGKAR